ncbi:MAG: hypothetical protein U0T84_08245 [Chitinophagales bacterium]
MKRFLTVLERGFVTASVCGIVFAIFNWITKGHFDHYVYFPFCAALFSFLISRNIRSQRLFLERRGGA